MANEIVERLGAYETPTETEALEVAAGLLVFYGPVPDQEFVAWLEGALPPLHEHLRARFHLTTAQLAGRTRRLRRRIEMYRREAARQAIPARGA